MCDVCRELLNEALNLALRSEQFEQQSRRQAMLAASTDPEAWQQDGLFDRYVEDYNIRRPDAKIAPKCLTVHLWVQDQYDEDLTKWTERSRTHLTQGCTPEENT